MSLGYRIVHAIFAPIFRLLFRVKVVGRENIPKGGPYILCANHTSIGDLFVLYSVFNQKVHYMAKKELFKVPIVSSIVRALGAFPVDRKVADMSAIRTTISMLDKNKTVGIFPQGKRYKRINPRETSVKNGIGMLAWHSKCGILPVALKTKNNHVHPFGRTTVIIGKLFDNDSLGFENGGTSEYKAVSNKVFDEICSLAEQ